MHLMAKTLLRVGAIAVGVALLSPHSASAQVGLGPTDHYKVYAWNQPSPVNGFVFLRDQFTSGDFQYAGPRWFSPPVAKNQEPINTPRFHMSWYDIFSPVPDPVRRVIAHNQFGSTELQVGDARWLLAPTLKNEPIIPGPFPQSFPVNHFKCYFATGNFVVRTVTLTTQFGTEVVQVGAPEFLCNPVEKHHNGLVYPMQHPQDHLVCYGISVTPALNVNIQRQDQFGFSQGIVLENRWLCVPSLKEIPTATEVTTWGRVRAHYR